MKITMKQLEAFSALMTLGTATAAATVLDTSQPSITRLLQQLEDATGLALFLRSKGRLEPTVQALELMEVVTEHFSGLNRIRHAAENIRLRKASHLRIACLPAFSQGLMARAIADFLERHHQVNISVSSLLSQGVTEAVRRHRIDLGIAAYEITASNLTNLRFTTCNEVFIMPASHRLRDRMAVSVRDLAGERIVRLVENDPYRQRFDQVLTENGIFLDNIVEIQTSAGVCALVTQGVGIALVNPLTALDFVDSGLVMRKFDHDLPFVTTLLQPENSTKSPLVSEFVETLIRRRDLDLKKSEELCRGGA